MQDWNYENTFSNFQVTIELGVDKWPPASALAELWEVWFSLRINNIFNFLFLYFNRIIENRLLLILVRFIKVYTVQFQIVREQKLMH